MSVANSDGDTIDLTSGIIKDVEVVNASSRSKAVQIIGNSSSVTGAAISSNTLKGGKGIDTIIGGTGNDYFTGGNGNDLFVYSGGNDTISDYTVNKNGIGDVIKLNFNSNTGLSIANALENYEIVDKNIIIPFSANGKNSLTILKGKDKKITFVDSSNATISAMTFTYSDPSTKVIEASDDSIYSFAADTLMSTESKARIKSITASKRTKPIYLVGSLDSAKFLSKIPSLTL